MRLLLQKELDDRQVRELHRLYRSEWWSEDRRLSDVRKMLAGSDRIYAYVEPDSERLVAFARVLTDGVYKAFILDVIVAASHRSTGLGRVLMQAILDDDSLRRVEDFELYCRPELAPFYQRFGFHRDLDEVQLMRKRRDG